MLGWALRWLCGLVQCSQHSTRVSHGQQVRHQEVYTACIIIQHNNTYVVEFMPLDRSHMRKTCPSGRASKERGKAVDDAAL